MTAHPSPLPTLLILCLSALSANAADLVAYPEYQRPSPFGGIVAPDRLPQSTALKNVTVDAPRATHVSVHLAADVAPGTPYTLQLTPAAPLTATLYREWFHFLPDSKSYIPDALIPVTTPYAAKLPDADNRVPNQTTAAFFLDIWIPASTNPGAYSLKATLRAANRDYTIPVKITVLAATAPAADALSIDHNTYGTSWFAEQYPHLQSRLGDKFYSSDEFFRLIHAYHQIFYEHRGVFHQLGYGHAGKVGPEFAPTLEGTGRTRRIADWSTYDRHYGPLFDGTAFANTERGPRPIPFVYLPINPEWPASFVNWGEPGYEREYVNVVSAMEQHFRDKGWTSTRLELFFNHKKRYKGFPWDGDETRFARDYAYLREYDRLTKLAVPANSPVKFVFRADASWTMEREFRELAGVINFWVCGGDMFSWYPQAAKTVKDRGDIVWTYGGTPKVSSPASAIATDLLRASIQRADGFVHWLATAPGPDPWFNFTGGAETLVYPGDRFGIDAPIPSIRLKIQRNIAEDLALLKPADPAEVARRFNNTTLADWWTPRPALADTDPEEWTNYTIDTAAPRNPAFAKDPAPDAWNRVHQYALELARRPQ